MKRISATIACILISCVLFAQQIEPKIKRVEFSSMSFNIGVLTSYEGFPNRVENFRKLAPNSEILDRDFEDTNNDHYYTTVNSDFAFSVGTYFSIKNKDGQWSKYHPQVRLGLTYAGQTTMSNNFYESEYFRVDTLISNRNGQVYYVDSVRTDYYSMNNYRDLLYLDAAILISSSPQNLFKFYGGVGLSVGVAFNSKTYIYFNQDSYIDTGVPLANNYSYPYTGENKEEVFLNDGSFTGMLSIPLGIEAKLSRSENAWAKCRLFLEARPSVAYTSIPEIGSNLIAAAVWGYGFKYDF